VQLSHKDRRNATLAANAKARSRTEGDAGLCKKRSLFSAEERYSAREAAPAERRAEPEQDCRRRAASLLRQGCDAREGRRQNQAAA